MKDIKEIEERLSRMEQQVSELTLALAKERAVTEIQNVMGRYAYLHTAGMHTQCVELFAVGDPELSIEIGPSGLFVGPDAADWVYAQGHNNYEADRVGFMAEHTLTTPVIEVADDLQTAKAIWISPGHETGLEKDGSISAEWMWGKYAHDFKYIDGKWKIWHFQMFPTFRCDYHKSWAETVAADKELAKFREEHGLDRNPSMFPGVEPDYPTTFFEEYASDRVTKYWPQPPEPYESFAGTRSMVGAPPQEVLDHAQEIAENGGSWSALFDL